MRHLGTVRTWFSDRAAEALYSPRSIPGQVALGRALLLICALIVSCSIWSLKPSRLAIPVLIVTSVVLCGVVVLSSRLPWTDGTSRRPLIFPFCVLAGITSIGLADTAAAAAYSGLIVLCFVYVGLTQRRWTSTLLTPFAVATWLACQTNWSEVTGIRLAIAITVWLVVGELLGYRSDRVRRDRLMLSGWLIPIR